MLRLLLVLFALSGAAPLIAACAEAPPKVPVLHEPGKTKTCPGGASSC